MGRLLIQFAGTNTTKALSETLPKNTIIVDEDLHQLRLHDGSTAGGHLIGGSSGSGVPVGTIIPFAGNSIPQGYLLCDGSAISRTTYASLFAVIGTIYGAGDGNSTFNLPDCRHLNPMMRFISSETHGTQYMGTIPNIKGHICPAQNADNGYGAWIAMDSGVGALTWFETGSAARLTVGTNISGRHMGIQLDASLYSSAYGIPPRNANMVEPAGLLMYQIIKY